MEKRLMNNHRDGGDVGMFNLVPFELCIQILSLLPVKSLLVLRAVCKWLISIIDDPEFASFHLRHFPDNVSETRFLSFRSFSFQIPDRLDVIVSYMASSSDHYPPVYSDHVTISHLGGFPFKCSLDGLVLLVRKYPFPLEDNVVVLWNPSTRSQRCLPLPTTRSDLEFALGYHAAGNDYKVVAVSCDEKLAWVYSVESCTWTSILNFHTSNSFITCLEDQEDRLSFKDGMVWISEGDSYDRLGRDEFSCVWFEFGTKRFYRVDDLAEKKWHSISGLVALDGGSTVGLWGYDVEDHPSIWALQTHTKSWIKRHKIVSLESTMQLRVKNIYNRSVVERDGKLVWTISMNEGAEAAWNGGFGVIRDVYIERLFMLH